jgi:hypothetical protein
MSAFTCRSLGFTRCSLALTLALSLAPALAFAQAGGGGGGAGGSGGGSGTGGTGSGGNAGASRPPTSVGRPQGSDPNLERIPMFISGTVQMQDGSLPPESVAIEKVCNGSAHREGYTDNKGHFSLQLNTGVQMQDASESDIENPGSPFGSSSSSSRMAGMMHPGTVNPRDLLGCEVRAVLAGYHSSAVMLRPEGRFGQIEVGTIVLGRLGPNEGGMVSITTMQAPHDARKALEKAQKLLKKKKDAEAEQELLKAVHLYPRFAAAWSLLGSIHGDTERNDDAIADFGKAIAADPQYVNPYFGLAVAAVKQKNWADVVRNTEQVVRLNPYAFADAYFYNAVANFNLGKLDACERSARKYQDSQRDHARPEIFLLMGEILIAKKDYAGAAQQKKVFLAMAPDSPRAAEVRDDVKRLEAANTAAAPKHPQANAPQPK